MPRYILFHKPYGVLTQFTDKEGRPTLADYIPIPDVYPAGRLDMNSEGLLLLTDDPRVLHRVTDPRWKLPKVYWVQVEGIPDEDALEQLRNGIVLKGKKTAPAEVIRLPEPPPVQPRPVRPYHPTPWLQITLREGRKRQIRRMTAAVGHPTLRLVRAAIGPLTLGTLRPGEWRDLTPEEVRALFHALNIDPRRPVQPRPRTKGRRKRRRRPRQ